MNPYRQYMYSYPHKTAYRSLSGVSLGEYAPLLAGKGHGLYMHIPFCQAKCGYCNLFSVTGQGKEAIDRYLDAAERQCRQYEETIAPFAPEFSELVIGGGTPLLLSEGQMERMFSCLKTSFSLEKSGEIVVETAPNQTEWGKLKVLVREGVTRVSMGIQSFSEQELTALGRQHGARQAREALERIKTCGFSCVNVDFIYGIPGQTIGSLLSSLKEALTFEPDEIFLYPLYIRHGAGLERAGMVLDPEEACQQYREASRFLRGEGFRQDSMRRFVRQNMERGFSECGLGTSLALGCGGRSYLGKFHFCSPYAITEKECMKCLEEYENTADFTCIRHGILLSEEEIKRRYVIRHLFIWPGLDTERYEKHFKGRAMEDYPLLEDWMEKGWLQWHGGPEQKRGNGKETGNGRGRFLALTQTGLELSDYLGPQLISPQIKRAMEEWEEAHGRAYDIISGQPEKL